MISPMVDQQNNLEDLLRSLQITFFERGWLSSNCVLLQGNTEQEGVNALVDSGYATHSEQTLALVSNALQGRPLDLLINTHLHSDHCGGNRLLQQTFPGLQTWIPPGLSQAVALWDQDAMTFAATGQVCEQFIFHRTVDAGNTVKLGNTPWEVHAAKGHDPHSIILFEPQHRVLISADALWENGFGVVFPELEGISAFDEVADTLDAIEALEPLWVLPGHGSPFTDAPSALEKARNRLNGFLQAPEKHTRYAIKVLLKFKLLELQKVSRQEFLSWCTQTPYLQMMAKRSGIDPIVNEAEWTEWVGLFLADLEHAGSLKTDGDLIFNS